MNPGPLEEAGQTARSFLDIMKEQPALLGSIVLNIGMLVFIFYALQGAAGYREKLTQQVASISPLVLALRTWICSPMARAASCTSRNVVSAVAFAGLLSTATRTALGTSSCRRPSRFAVTSPLKKLMPV